MADWIDLVDKKKLICNILQILDRHINASAEYPTELFEIKRELLESIYIEQSFITQDSINRWIPCSERLPETDVDVLAYYPYWYDNMFHNTGIVVATLSYDRLTWDICGEFNPALSAITHWMQLPNNPEVIPNE